MTRNECLNIIEKKRTELQEIVTENGLNSQLTIMHSQELDRLLNTYADLFLREYKVH